MLQQKGARGGLLATKNGGATVGCIGSYCVRVGLMYRKLRLNSLKTSIHVRPDEDAQAFSSKKHICLLKFAPKRPVFTCWPNSASLERR